MIFAVFFEILRNLRRKFTRRFENEAARHARTRTAIGKHIDHRKDEARGFTRARLCDCDDVTHHLDLRDSSGLNWGWLVIASLA